MGKFKVTLMMESTPVKPQTDEEKLEWSRKIGKAPEVEITLEELAGFVSDLQHSWCHATFAPQWIHRDNFFQSQMIVVDVDGGLSPQQALDRCTELDIPKPNIIYRTLSDATDPSLSTTDKLTATAKFRMIFVLDAPVYNLREYELLVKEGMYILFPESDHVSATQKWLGGQETIYLDTDSRLSAIQLMAIADVFDTRDIGEKGRQKRYKKKYSALPPDIFHNGLVVDASVPKTANSYSIYKENGENGTKLILGFDWAAACVEFQLLNDFILCTRKITNPELLGLFSGMRRIEGGRKLWRESILNNPLINVRHLAIEDWFNSVTGKGKNPWEQLISYYAPFDPAGKKYHRLTDLHFRQGQPAIKLRSTIETPVVDAELKMYEFIQSALESTEQSISVCQAVTALGKTEAIICNLQDGCIIATPTHDLKNEIAERCRIKGIDIRVMPDDPVLPESVQQELEKIRASGDYERAARFLRRMSHGLSSGKFGLTGKEASELQGVLKKYFDELNDCINTTLPVLTTHKRILYTSFPNHHTLIIDEDIIPSLFETKSFTTKDLRILLQAMRGSTYPGYDKDMLILEGLLGDLKSNSALSRHVQSTYEGRTEIFEDYDEISNAVYRCKHKLKGEILPFFNCDYYIADKEEEGDPDGEMIVQYVTKHRFPADKKVIILSATASRAIYAKVFGQIVWVQISHVKHTGKRIQCSDLSHSRSTIASLNNRRSLKSVKDFIGDMPTITFKRYRHLFSSPAEVTLENCSGYDGLKGRDIAVIGTPHVPTIVYRLMAAALGIEFKAEDFVLEPQWVEHNGYRFHFMTYAHEGLRSIQFYYIESALVQACGRNRGLREDVACYLFSNYPLAGFEQHSTKELPRSSDSIVANKTRSIPQVLSASEVSGSTAA